MTHTVSPPTDSTTSPTPHIRWKVACINWGHPDAPHAMTYRLRDAELQAEHYWPTWADAVAHIEVRRQAEWPPLWTDLFGIDPTYGEVSA